MDQNFYSRNICNVCAINSLTPVLLRLLHTTTETDFPKAFVAKIFACIWTAEKNCCRCEKVVICMDDNCILLVVLREGLSKHHSCHFNLKACCYTVFGQVVWPKRRDLAHIFSWKNLKLFKPYNKIFTGISNWPVIYYIAHALTL